MKEVCSFKAPFESLIRKDNPETQLDKLVIIDQLLGIAKPEGFSHIDQNSVQLINKKIAKVQSVPSKDRYDQPVLNANKFYSEKLQTLYFNLLEQKYQPIVNEQKACASVDLQKKIKRLARDDPSIIHELP